MRKGLSGEGTACVRHRLGKSIQIVRVECVCVGGLFGVLRIVKV